jgi:hypothetical protein
MLVFMTHDHALMLSRFNRMVFVVSSLFIVMIMDALTSGTVGYVSLGAGFVGQIIILKQWLDMSLMKQPFLNCWAFKE